MARKHDFVGKFEKILHGQFADLEAPKAAVVVPAILSTDEQVESVLAERNSD